MTRWKVACLDVWDPEVQRIVLEVAPPELDVSFASSYDETHQFQLATQSDFIVAGWAPVPARIINNAPALKLIQKWGIGCDKIDLGAAQERGIPVAITAGENASPVAELTIALMLAVCRSIPYVDRSLRNGVWLKTEMRARSLQLRGKTIGLLGFGHIARQVARKLAGFETRLAYFDVVRAAPEIERELAVSYMPFKELLSAADILSIHVPLEASTRNLLDREAIAGMKDGAVVVNTSRGGVVDEAALHDALERGKLYGAGLDTFALEPPSADNPLLSLEQVVVTPHVGGAVIDNVANVTNHAFGNILRVLRGEPLPPQDVKVAIPERGDVRA